MVAPNGMVKPETDFGIFRPSCAHFNDTGIVAAELELENAIICASRIPLKKAAIDTPPTHFAIMA